MTAIFRASVGGKLIVDILDGAGPVYNPREECFNLKHEVPQRDTSNTAVNNSNSPLSRRSFLEPRSERNGPSKAHAWTHCETIESVTRPSSPAAQDNTPVLQAEDWLRWNALDGATTTGRGGTTPFCQTKGAKVARMTLPMWRYNTLHREKDSFVESLRKYPAPSRRRSGNRIKNYRVDIRHVRPAPSVRSLPERRIHRNTTINYNKPLRNTQLHYNRKLKIPINESCHYHNIEHRLSQLIASFDYLNKMASERKPKWRPKNNYRNIDVCYITDMTNSIKEKIRKICDIDQTYVNCPRMTSRFCQHYERCYNADENTQRTVLNSDIGTSSPVLFANMDYEKDLETKIQEETHKWMNNIPVNINDTNENQDLRQDRINKLIKILTELLETSKAIEFAEKGKYEIKECLNAIPIWLPDSKMEKLQFIDKLAQKLIDKISDIPIDDSKMDESEKFDRELLKIFKNMHLRYHDDKGHCVDPNKLRKEAIIRLKALPDDMNYNETKLKVLEILGKFPIDVNDEDNQLSINQLIDAVSRKGITKYTSLSKRQSELEKAPAKTADNYQIYKRGIAGWLAGNPRLMTKLTNIDEASSKLADRLQTIALNSDNASEIIIKEVREWIASVADKNDETLTPDDLDDHVTNLLNNINMHFQDLDVNPNYENNGNSIPVSQIEDILRDSPIPDVKIEYLANVIDDALKQYQGNDDPIRHAQIRLKITTDILNQKADLPKEEAQKLAERILNECKTKPKELDTEKTNIKYASQPYPYTNVNNVDTKLIKRQRNSATNTESISYQTDRQPSDIDNYEKNVADEIFNFIESNARTTNPEMTRQRNFLAKDTGKKIADIVTANDVDDVTKQNMVRDEVSQFLRKVSLKPDVNTSTLAFKLTDRIQKIPKPLPRSVVENANPKALKRMSSKIKNIKRSMDKGRNNKKNEFNEAPSQNDGRMKTEIKLDKGTQGTEDKDIQSTLDVIKLEKKEDNVIVIEESKNDLVTPKNENGDKSNNRKTSVSQNQTKSGNDVVDELYQSIESYVTELCEAQDAEHKTALETEKNDVINKMALKIGALNINPEIVNDEFLYEQLVSDEIDQALANIPIAINADKNKLMHALKAMRKKAQNELIKNTFKQQIRDVVTNNTPNAKCYEKPERKFAREMLREDIVDSYITNYDSEGECLNQSICNYLQEYVKTGNVSACIIGNIFDAIKEDLNKIQYPDARVMKSLVKETKLRSCIFEILNEHLKTSWRDKMKTSKLLPLMSKRLLDISNQKESEERSQNINSEVKRWLEKIPIAEDFSDTDDTKEDLANQITDLVEATITDDIDRTERFNRKVPKSIPALCRGSSFCETQTEHATKDNGIQATISTPRVLVREYYWDATTECPKSTKSCTKMVQSCAECANKHSMTLIRGNSRTALKRINATSKRNRSPRDGTHDVCGCGKNVIHSRNIGSRYGIACDERRCTCSNAAGNVTSCMDCHGENCPIASDYYCCQTHC